MHVAPHNRLEAKRLTSGKATKVYDRLREAANQLRNAGLDGFAALSLDSWVTDLGEDPEPEAVGTLFNEQLAEAREQLNKVPFGNTIFVIDPPAVEGRSHVPAR